MAELDQEFLTDSTELRMCNFYKDKDEALAQALRLSESEEDRRKTTEAKATTYLLFMGAFLPVFTFFDSFFSNDTISSIPKIIYYLIIFLFVLAMCYLLAAGRWAFKAIGVSVFHRVDVSDISSIWKSYDPKINLIKRTLLAVRQDRTSVNYKVSCIKMAELFIVRAFILFGMFVLFEIGGKLIYSTFNQINSGTTTNICLGQFHSN